MRSEPTGDTRAVSVRASLKRHSCSRSVTRAGHALGAGRLAQHLGSPSSTSSSSVIPSGAVRRTVKRPSQRSWDPSPTSIAKVSTSSRGTIVASIGSAPSGNGGVVGEPVGGGLAAVGRRPRRSPRTRSGRPDRRCRAPEPLRRRVGTAGRCSPSVDGVVDVVGPGRRSRATRPRGRRSATATRDPAAGHPHRPAATAARDRRVAPPCRPGRRPWRRPTDACPGAGRASPRGAGAAMRAAIAGPVAPCPARPAPSAAPPAPLP